MLCIPKYVLTVVVAVFIKAFGSFTGTDVVIIDDGIFVVNFVIFLVVGNFIITLLFVLGVGCKSNFSSSLFLLWFSWCFALYSKKKYNLQIKEKIKN